jgi:hypothetical protein
LATCPITFDIFGVALLNIEIALLPKFIIYITLEIYFKLFI